MRSWGSKACLLGALSLGGGGSAVAGARQVHAATGLFADPVTVDGGKYHIRELDRCVDASEGGSNLVVHLAWESHAPVAVVSRYVFINAHAAITTLVKSEGRRDLKCAPAPDPAVAPDIVAQIEFSAKGAELEMRHADGSMVGRDVVSWADIHGAAVVAPMATKGSASKATPPPPAPVAAKPSPSEVLVLFEEMARVVDQHPKDCEALGTALLRFFETNKARMAAAEALDEAELERAFEGPLEKRAMAAIGRIHQRTEACRDNAKVKAAMKHM